MAPDHGHFGNEEDQEERGGEKEKKSLPNGRGSDWGLTHEVEALEECYGNDGPGSVGMPDPIVYQHGGGRRMTIDGRAVAIQTHGNHGEIAVARFAGHVALGAKFDITVKKGTC